MSLESSNVLGIFSFSFKVKEGLLLSSCRRCQCSLCPGGAELKGESRSRVLGSTAAASDHGKWDLFLYL